MKSSTISQGAVSGGRAGCLFEGRMLKHLGVESALGKLDKQTKSEHALGRIRIDTLLMYYVSLGGKRSPTLVSKRITRIEGMDLLREMQGEPPIQRCENQGWFNTGSRPSSWAFSTAESYALTASA